METYISILRGVNVTGHNKISMVELKSLYEKLKFKEVITYIQSGNVIFKTQKVASDQVLSQKIEKAIEVQFQYKVPVVIRSVEEMAHIILSNPFLKQKGIDLERLHVTFLNDNPDPANVERVLLLDFSPDKFIIAGKEIYLYCPNGYGITKLSNTFFENKLKVTATTRNWRTVNKLAELGKYK